LIGQVIAAGKLNLIAMQSPSLFNQLLEEISLPEQREALINKIANYELVAEGKGCKKLVVTYSS